MNTDLEVIPLQARLRNSGLVLAALAALAAITASPVHAQTGKTGDRVMIPTLQSSDKDLGVQAADAIRNQLQKQTNLKELVVVPKSDINNSLQSSGYSTTEALASGDAKALATLVRAPQYLEGTVTKTPTGVKIDSRLIIARDPTRGQVLPSAQSARLDDAAAQVARSIKDARRQLPGEESCHNNVAQGKYQEGIKAARNAMANDPNANIAAVCLAEGYAGLKMDDSVIAVTERIRASDPRNIKALRMLAELYQARKDPKGLDVLSQLAAADPTNIKLIQDVVNEYARTGQAQRAVPLVRDLLQNNPGDPQLLNLAWLVYLNAKDYQGAIDIGNEMVRVDTAAATADYYKRLAAAYTAINQPQRASEAAARGAAKFPNDPTLAMFSAQAMIRAGQTQQAAEVARRALAANPSLEPAYLVLFQAYGDQPDTLYSVLQRAGTANVNKSILANFALQQGNKAFETAKTSKRMSDYNSALRFLQLSNQMEESPTASFLIGYTSVLRGQDLMNAALTQKNCDLARQARDAFNLASAALPLGGKQFPNEAAQLLTAIPTMTPTVESEIKRFCR
jgi:lipopolysaccharide biosynthesis regulator YciM